MPEGDETSSIANASLGASFNMNKSLASKVQAKKEPGLLKKDSNVGRLSSTVKKPSLSSPMKNMRQEVAAERKSQNSKSPSAIDKKGSPGLKLDEISADKGSNPSLTPADPRSPAASPSPNPTPAENANSTKTEKEATTNDEAHNS